MDNHLKYSLIKSGLRIVGAALLPVGLPVAAGVLMFAEIFGIVEEIA